MLTWEAVPKSTIGFLTITIAKTIATAMKTKTILLIVMIIACRNLPAQSTADIISYINTYKDIAISEMQRTGIPASITLAQGIHETLAGTSELVKKSNNHFGIKCKDTWTGSVVYHDDDERGECFRGYNSPQDSYKDHSDFLRRRKKRFLSG